jgi:predicted transcriptional regulator of viral defense system
MAPRTRFSQNQLQISTYFENLPGKIWTYSELSEICEDYHDQWNLPISMQPKKFIALLVEKTKMQAMHLIFPSNRIARYVWGEKPNLFALSATIHERAYFSHLSAIYLNGLVSDMPKEIYVNVEQKERPGNEVNLTQGGIDTAFKKKPRITSNRSFVDGCAINLLNGKQTANLGIIKKGFEGIGVVPVSNIERTLIDIAVRPTYSGGVANVLNAYKASHGQVSTELIADYLIKISHKYPYHQSIGFYLEKAGFSEESISVLEKIKKEFTFYLDYQMENPKYSKKWNLYYPGEIE